MLISVEALLRRLNEQLHVWFWWCLSLWSSASTGDHWSDLFLEIGRGCCCCCYWSSRRILQKLLDYKDQLYVRPHRRIYLTVRSNICLNHTVLSQVVGCHCVLRSSCISLALNTDWCKDAEFYYRFFLSLVPQRNYILSGSEMHEIYRRAGKSQKPLLN